MGTSGHGTVRPGNVIPRKEESMKMMGTFFKGNLSLFDKEAVPSVLFPHKMWERVRDTPKRRGSIPEEWPVLVGWMFRNTREHWLVCEIETGLYSGVSVNRDKNKAGHFTGMLGDPYGLASLVSQGVEIDRSCGLCDYTVAEVFGFMKWNKEMLKDVPQR